MRGNYTELDLILKQSGLVMVGCDRLCSHIRLLKSVIVDFTRYIPRESSKSKALCGIFAYFFYLG